MASKTLNIGTSSTIVDLNSYGDIINNNTTISYGAKSSGDSISVDFYLEANGFLTTSNKQIIVYTTLPCFVTDLDYSSISLTSSIVTRCDGTYILHGTNSGESYKSVTNIATNSTFTAYSGTTSHTYTVNGLYLSSPNLLVIDLLANSSLGATNNSTVFMRSSGSSTLTITY